jgi:hypothetical protein
MKLLTILGISTLIVAPVGFASTDKFEIESHAHQHQAGCGHKEIPHGDHVDYQHDSQYHAKHGSHFDNHGIVVSKSSSAGRALASADHAVAEEHTHKHGKKCGHKAVRHGDHTDYLHDGQYHAMHSGHYDLHGAPVAN